MKWVSALIGIDKHEQHWSGLMQTTTQLDCDEFWQRSRFLHSCDCEYGSTGPVYLCKSNHVLLHFNVFLKPSGSFLLLSIWHWQVFSARLHFPHFGLNLAGSYQRTPSVFVFFKSFSNEVPGFLVCNHLSQLLMMLAVEVEAKCRKTLLFLDLENEWLCAGDGDVDKCIPSCH